MASNLSSVPPAAAHRVALLGQVPAGDLLIHEIYKSIQGESTFAGLPCVFVRTSACDLRCSWCFVPETPVLMEDWSWRPIGELRPGDRVVAVEPAGEPGRHAKVSAAAVTAALTREADTVLVNGAVRCTPDHKFWLTGKDAAGGSAAHDGWREVSRMTGLRARFLAAPAARHPGEYERGWLAGMADGDGCFWTLGPRGYRRFRLALTDHRLLDRFAEFAGRAGYRLHQAVHAHVGFKGPGRTPSLWLTRDAAAKDFERWLAEDVGSEAWRYGYLGGIIDAEGSLSRRVLRVAQDREANPRTWDRIRQVLDGLGFKYTEEVRGFYVHRTGGELWRVLANARPAKGSVLRAARESGPRHSRVIESVVPTGLSEPVVTLTTTLGNYVAAGFVVKNCDTPHAFARGERMPRSAVLDKALSYDCPLVEVTGGEPLLQPDVLPLMSELCDAGKTVLLETSGAHDVGPVDPRVHVVMDLKCPDSGESHRNHWPNLDKLKPTDQIKFVIASRRDWEWAEGVVRTHRLDERFEVLVSAAFGGVTPRELVDWLLASRLNCRMQLQMHKYIWDPKATGV